MATFQSPRGTRDILPEDQPSWTHVKRVAEEVAMQMGFSPITVPTYEELSLFQRAIGEGTDIQDKELFIVRGRQSNSDEERYALRPEGTAGIVRAFIQHGMQTRTQPVKLFSTIQNFRYDRPQKGRYREHTQFDLEYFGDVSPFADAWIIYTSWRILERLELHTVQLDVNSLGTEEERIHYCKKLSLYLEANAEALSEDSRRRIHTNPLRVLDSKDRNDQGVREHAPTLADSLSESSATHFKEVLSYLTTWNIPFTINPFLVRGLDYYSHTAFEWTVNSDSGQQSSLGGGGRYDGLMKKLDGPHVGAVGVALGLDRVVELLATQNVPVPKSKKPDLYLIAADEKGTVFCTEIIPKIWQYCPKLHLECDLGKVNVGNQLKRAVKIESHYVLVIGTQEQESGNFTLKNLRDSTTEHYSSLESLLEFLKNEG